MGAQTGTPPTGQVINKFEIALGQALLQAKLLTPAQLSQAMWEKTENNLYLTDICLENDWIPQADLYAHVPTDQLRIEEILLLYGYLTLEQLQEIIAAQKSNVGQPLSDLLISQGWVDSEVVDWAVAEQQALQELAQTDAWQTIQHRLAEFHAESSESGKAEAPSIDPSATESDADLDVLSFNPVSFDDSSSPDTADPLTFHDPDPAPTPAPQPEPAFLEDPQVTQELEQLRAQVETLQEQLQTRQQQNHQALQAATQQTQQGLERIATLEQALQTLEAERDQLQQHLAQQQQQAQDQLTLQHQLQDLEARAQHQQTESEAAHQQLQDLHDQKAQLEKQLHDTRQAAKKLHGQFQQKIKEQAQAQAQIKQLQHHLEQHQEQSQQLQAEREQIPQLQEQITELTQQLAQAQAELQQRVTQQDQAQHQIQDLQQHLETQRDIQQQVQAKSQKALELLEEQIRSLTQQLENTQEAYQASGALLKQHQTRAEKLSEEKDQAIDQQLQAERRAAQAEQTGQTLRHQFQTQQEQITLLETQLRQEQQQVQAQQIQIQQLEAAQSTAQTQAAQQQEHQSERWQVLNEELQQAQAQCSAQAAQIESLQQQIESLQQQLDQALESTRTPTKSRPLKRPQPVQAGSITEQIAEAWGIDAIASDTSTQDPQTDPVPAESTPPPVADPAPAAETELEDLFQTEISADLESPTAKPDDIPEEPTPTPPTQLADQQAQDQDLASLMDDLVGLDAAPELDEPDWDDLSELDELISADPPEEEPAPVAESDSPSPPPRYRRTTADPFDALLEDWDKELEELATAQEQEEESPALAAATPWERRVMTALQQAALISRRDAEMILSERKRLGGTFTQSLSRFSGLKPETVKFFSDGGYSAGLMGSSQLADYLKASGLVSEQEIQTALLQVESGRSLTQVLVDQGILLPETANYFVKNFGSSGRGRRTTEERFG